MNNTENRPKCKKSKLMRIERKKEKMAQKGITLESCQPKPAKALEKSLEDFLSEEHSNGVYKLKVHIMMLS